MKRWLGAMAIVALLGGAAAWLCRDSLLGRYYVHRLTTAGDADVAGWVGQAPAWGNAVADRLVDRLAADDATVCSRAAAALGRLAASGGTADIPTRLAERFADFSPVGRQAAIDCLAELDQSAGRGPGRQLVRTALHDPDPAVRLRAATLALRPASGHVDLLVPILNDPAAEVRRTAMLAVGPERSLLADDDLLRWLHDADAEVRRLTETSLRSRGLRSGDIRLGRLLTDRRPSARLQLLDLLHADGELDLSAWLRRLLDDPAPAVRAAAARLADEHQVFQLTDRLSQMVAADPDLTVRQAVVFHLRHIRSPVRPVSAP